MAYRNLDEFLTRLEQSGKAVRKPISAQIPYFSDVCASDNNVTIFEDPANSLSFVSNLFGTRERIEQGLRVVSLDLIADRLGAMLDLGTPSSFGSLVGQAMSLFTALRTTSSKRAPQDYRSLSAHEWASQFSSAARAGRPASLLAALMTSRHMASAVVDVSGEAMLIESASALTAGDRIAIVFGGDPAFILATLTPLPDLVHRSYFASWLRERPIETMRLADIDVDLPSNAEAVVSGTVSDVVRGNSIRLLDPMSHKLTIAVESAWVMPNAILPVWSERDRYTVLEGLFIVFKPLLRRMLPGLSDEQIRKIVSGTASEYNALLKGQY
ncbi:MAG: UbiD family decarboxylase [Anaerolineae bacterium]|nr:UbiD family decarboxylase [Anaerolineae bacterium]